MPKGNATSLFVSSTCFDLSQVRSDIRDFADSVGLDPILSEFDAFPVNPNESTITNCLDVVRNRADIFLLVVGGRYGSIADTGKSVTNMEFNEACAKGIPKYVFIKEDILSLLPVWDANKEADFSSVVDTPQLFEFISEIRNSGEVWVFPFSNAQDIVRALRKQLSYLLSDCLDIRRRFHELDIDLTKLKPKALRLLIEKPKAWEYLLFAQLLKDSVRENKSKRLDVELGISLGEPISLADTKSVTDWVSTRLNWIATTIEQLTAAINTGFVKALGQPGEPADIERMIHLASRIGDSYNQLLDWKLQFLRVNVNEEFKRLIVLISEMATNAINEIEEFSRDSYEKIETVFRNEDKYGKGTTVEFILTLTAPDTSALTKELSRLTRIAHKL